MIPGSEGTTPPAARALRALKGAAGALALIGTLAAPATGASEPEALRIGLLMNFGGDGTGAALDRRRAFELAIRHVNDGGGVLGLPVTFAVGDTGSDPAVAVEEARRLVEVEGAHAVVSPGASAAALPVAERVIGSAGVPTVSFSATSPALTSVADDDFLFRTALSDVAQGPVLARLARERGFDNVGLLHVDDPWGRGLAAAFEAAWDGAVETVAVEPGRTDFLAELRRSASGGAQALVTIAFEDMAAIAVREAIENDLYDRFLFGDAAKRLSLARSIGGDRLADMYGTGPATAPGSAASAAWEEAYVAEYGALPVLAYVKETYDATVALALAAQAAGRLDGAAIRDRLRAVGGAPGAVVVAGPRGVAEALRILAQGGEIDYEGASGDMDWDENGDPRRGHVGVWRFTEDERIEDVAAVPFGP